VRTVRCLLLASSEKLYVLFQASPPVMLDNRRLSIEERRGKCALFLLLNLNLLTLFWQILLILSFTNLSSKYAVQLCVRV
jgi:hypothetical protein